ARRGGGRLRRHRLGTSSPDAVQPAHRRGGRVPRPRGQGGHAMSSHALDPVAGSIRLVASTPSGALDDCYHGGAFFEAIGEEFETLERRHDIVPADVLDAWFPPAPAVLEALREHLDWLVRTSPPTHRTGLPPAIPR